MSSAIALVIWLCYQTATPTITSYVIAPMEVDSSRAKSADRMTTRQRRALSAIARPKTSALLRPASVTKPRRPYSAYTQRGAEEDTPQYDPPQSEREWWRYYVKVQVSRSRAYNTYIYTRTADRYRNTGNT